MYSAVVGLNDHLEKVSAAKLLDSLETSANCGLQMIRYELFLLAIVDSFAASRRKTFENQSPQGPEILFHFRVLETCYDARQKIHDCKKKQRKR